MIRDLITDEAAVAHAALAVNEAAGNAARRRAIVTTYEIVQDCGEMEHITRRPTAAWEHVPVCGELETPFFDGPEPALCGECQGWLAIHGDRDLLVAAVAGARARWLACLPGASPAAAEVLASADDTP